MTTTNNTILTNKEIKHKIKRIAYQIYESNINEDKIVLAGIVENGYKLTEEIAKELQLISQINVSLCKVYVDKQNPLKEVSTSISEESYTNKSIVLIDDVLNSGTTLIYAIKHFLNVPLKRFKTAVLVNRNHKKYPVKADFKGISLSTSIKEHVTVEFNNNEITAYLS